MPAIIRKIFEEEFTKVTDVEQSIAVNSGTSALIAALWSMDLQPGDEVITTPFTFIATSNAILIAGGTPVFVDIDPDTLLIDPDKIEGAITDRTKAIIPVHLYGRVCKMHRIMDIARANDLMVIEDTAQAFGAIIPPKGSLRVEDSNKFAGSMGDVGCFSFYKTKNISTFEGGMVTINKGSKMDGAKIRSIVDQGQVGKYNHEYIGFNFRLAEPCCLIGLEAIKIHMTGIRAELGMRGPTQGHYPNVVYQQPAYIKRGITGNCPIAEGVAKSIKDGTYVE
jgi:dTDP-4-amino-4,6-dideoxygalactose transaminase